jgi:hypothetical protein
MWRLNLPWGIIALWWASTTGTGSSVCRVAQGAVVDSAVDNFLERQWWWNLKDANPNARRCLTVDAPWFPCTNNTNNSAVAQTLLVVYLRTFGVVKCGRAYTRAQTRWGPIVTWSAANASSWYTVLFIDTSDTAYVTHAQNACVLSIRSTHSFFGTGHFLLANFGTVHIGRVPWWIQSTSHSALWSRQCTGHGVAKWLGYDQIGSLVLAASD